MVWHWLITPIVFLMNTLFNALPPWNVDLGNSWLHYSLLWLAPLDKFMPLHDGFLPIFTITLAIFVALLAVKLLKFVLSCIPTISAGG